MAIKKSELYSSLWASCDELRGGMDASQYKDYVLVMLFIKYISDKWAGQVFAPIEIPEGASFADMVALKGKPDIGDQINKKIIAPLAKENDLIDMPDFNDVNKLGSGKEMVDRLTNLIAIFENPALDFSKNKAEGDDILGDAYEYLMRHFATESGKSKGQFYTPAEVSRTMAQIIGIHQDPSAASETIETMIYDPTCGSGSLLLKIGDQIGGKVSLFGQEKDATTAGLAKMNMILHDKPYAEVVRGNTLASPKFTTKENQLRTFDYVVANPPFSDKRWSNGLTLPDDQYKRFEGFGIPPAKNGDYAFLLHIIRSLKRHGKGAIILPHGVLFRGNAEAEIRQNLIRRGYIKGIIGLPANLFYGTGIPAAIIVIDKENADHRQGIFMIDAGKDFIKDGNKNRLREQDIRKIADVFNQQLAIPGYSKMVPFADIQANDYNLNIPRYIENQETEDIQDIAAHLLGGIPNKDIATLEDFWAVYPQLKNALFQPSDRPNYVHLSVPKADIKETIFSHPEFVAFTQTMDTLFSNWQIDSIKQLKGLTTGFNPKNLIHQLSEGLLTLYAEQPLIDKYDMYQHLRSYWSETMQDDCYLISADGWQAEIQLIQVTKGKRTIDKGWTCDLLPKYLVINRYFATEKAALADLQATKESIASQITELVEEHSSEGGFFAEMEKVNKATVNARLKVLKALQKEGDLDAESQAELKVLSQYIHLLTQQSAKNKQIKNAEGDLDKQVKAKYPTLSEAELKVLVVEDKWMQSLSRAIKGEIDHISQRLHNQVSTLAARYEKPLPAIEADIRILENKVTAHLQKMGFLWN